MAQIYSEFGPHKKLSADFRDCFERTRPDSEPIVVSINDWYRPLAENEKPFPIPSWRKTDNPKKLSDATTKCTASPEAIARIKAELARRGVEVKKTH